LWQNHVKSIFIKPMRLFLDVSTKYKSCVCAILSKQNLRNFLKAQKSKFLTIKNHSIVQTKLVIVNLDLRYLFSNEARPVECWDILNFLVHNSTWVFLWGYEDLFVFLMLYIYNSFGTTYCSMISSISLGFLFFKEARPQEF